MGLAILEDGREVNTYEVNPQAACPACGILAKEVAEFIPGPNTRGPQAGDLLICCNCAQPLVFTAGGLLRTFKVSDRELLAELSPVQSIELVAMIAHIVARGPFQPICGVN